MGGYGIVGGNLPIAAGIALSSDYRETDEVTVCVFGDGAANQGTFGETLNLAALWKLPVVFMVTNNQFGMGTALERHTAQTDLHQRGEGFGVPGMRCDGMDVVDTYEVLSEAIETVRTDRTPILVEAETYRFRGHSMADPEEYRDKEQVEEWRKRDPIPNYAEAARPRRGRRRRSSTRPRSRASTRPSSSPTPPTSPPPESIYDHVYVLGDQVKGWYSVDERSAGVHKGEDERSLASSAGAAVRAGRRAGRRGGRRGRGEGRRRGPGGRGLVAEMRYREALNAALREELAARRARPDHGRGHRRLQRRLQGHAGPAGGVRREARARHADLREHDRRRRRRRRDDRPAARRRADDGQLLAAGDGPDRQPHGDDPLHVRRPGDGADGRADAAGRRPPARRRRTRTASRRSTCTCRGCCSPCRPRRPTRRAC